MAGYDLFTSIEKTKELGFQGIASLVGGEKHSHSLGEVPTFGWYNLDEGGKRKLKEALKDFKHITVHQSWDKKWKDWIDCAEHLGAEVLTIHHNIAKQPFFSEVCEYLQDKKLKIGIENEGGKYNEYVELIKSIEHPQIGATIDTGHCSLFAEIKTIENLDQRAEKLNGLILNLIKDLKRKIYLFHLHNVRKYEDVDFSKIPHPYWKEGDLVDHRCISEGLINFQKIFSLLKEIGYQCLFEIELEEPEKEEKAYKSGDYLTKLLGLY